MKQLLFIIFVFTVLIGCRHSQTGPQGNAETVDGNIPNVEKKFRKLSEFASAFPELGASEQVFCRSLDPELDPSELMLLNPEFSAVLPKIELSVTDTKAKANIQTIPTISVEYSPIRTGSFDLGYGQTVFYNTDSSETFYVAVSAQNKVYGEYLFGVVGVFKSSTYAYQQNVLCRVNNTLLASSKEGTPSIDKEPSFPDFVETIASPLIGRYESPCFRSSENEPYMRVSVSFFGSDMRTDYTLSQEANCESPMMAFAHIGRRTAMGESVEKDNHFFWKFEIKKVLLAFGSADFASFANAGNFCGVRNWASSVPKDISNLDCGPTPLFKSDRIQGFATYQDNSNALYLGGLSETVSLADLLEFRRAQ